MSQRPGTAAAAAARSPGGCGMPGGIAIPFLVLFTVLSIA